MIYTKLRLIGAHPVDDDDPDGDWRILVEEIPVFFLRPFILSRIRSYIGGGTVFHDEETGNRASYEGYLSERLWKARQLYAAKDKFKRK